jgi:RNA polymerase sigma-70 factor (ECF subfamily)
MNARHSELATADAVAGTFDDIVLPHLDAGYRLARWLMANEHDAEDVVQEAALRAFLYFRTFSGGNGRAWFLRIVRNTSYRWRRSHLIRERSDPFDEERHSARERAPDPEVLLLHSDDAGLILGAMSRLPDRFRELLVLRELEELSYQEMADVMSVPIGTIMSGLSRARQALRGQLKTEMNHGGIAAREPQPEPEADAAVV